MALVGLIPTIITALTLIVPLVGGHLVSNAPSKKRLIIVVNAVGRPAIMLMVPILLFIGDSSLVIVAFVLLISLFSASQSISGLAWQDLFAMTIAERARDRLLGTLQVVAGICSLVASFFVKALLDTDLLDKKLRFASIFLLAGFFLSLSIPAMLGVREQARASDDSQDRRLKSYLASLLACFADKTLRNLTFVTILGLVAASGSAFIYLFASNNLGMQANEISVLIVVQTVGAISSGLLWPRIARAFGNKYVIVIAELLTLVMAVLCLLSRQGSGAIWLMSLVVFLFGIRMGSWVGYTNYLLEFIDAKTRIQSLVFKNTLVFPFSFVSVLAGILVDNVGMVPLLVVQIFASTIAGLCAITLLLGKVKLA